MKTREEVQREALIALIEHNGGTIVMSPGTGKSKVAIDFIKHKQAKKILITSPRTNLKESWKQELAKWELVKDADFTSFSQYSYIPTMVFMNSFNVAIIIENIQTCYKWDKEKVSGFDLIVFDEIHTMVTEEYGELIKLAKRSDITIVGLTGTPDDKKLIKSAFYMMFCPIIYRYTDSAKDGIINKRKYIVYKHELNDDYMVDVTTKTSSWKSGEKKQYDYAQSRVDDGQLLILEELKKPIIEEISRLNGLEPSLATEKLLNASHAKLEKLTAPDSKINYFGYADKWYWKGDGTPSQKIAGGTYMRGITARKDLLWKLTSTATIAKAMAEHIINTYDDSKVLVFSERTEQASRISSRCVHSGFKDDENAKTLDEFNNGIIRQLGSCYSLTLGLNLKHTGYAIMESYNSSSVHFKQRSGRVDRLPVDQDAIVIFIVVSNTQCEKWFEEAVNFTEDDEVIYVSNFEQYKNALKIHKEN